MAEYPIHDPIRERLDVENAIDSIPLDPDPGPAAPGYALTDAEWSVIHVQRIDGAPMRPEDVRRYINARIAARISAAVKQERERVAQAIEAKALNEPQSGIIDGVYRDAARIARTARTARSAARADKPDVKLIRTSYGVMPETIYEQIRLNGVTEQQFDRLMIRAGSWQAVREAIDAGEHLR